MKTRLGTSFLLLAFAAALLKADPVTTNQELKLFEAGRAWTFNPGSEFAPGGKGSFKVIREDGKDVGVLAYDLTAGGTYVGGAVLAGIPEGFSELRFKVRSDRAASIGIRILDATRQTHQTPLSYTDAGQWQLFRIDLTRRAALKFGGAADGVLHYPLRGLTLFVQRKGQDAPGEIRFTDFVLLK